MGNCSFTSGSASFSFHLKRLRLRCICSTADLSCCYMSSSIFSPRYLTCLTHLKPLMSVVFSLPQNPKTPYVSVIRSLIYQDVSAAHSERQHISELNVDFIKKFELGMGPPAADRALLENEPQLGMYSVHLRVAHRKG